MKFPANTTYVNLKHIYTSHNVHFSKITLHLCIHSEHIHIYIHTYIYFFFLVCVVQHGIPVPQPGTKPTAPVWESRVLATGPPGTFLSTGLNTADWTTYVHHLAPLISSNKGGDPWPGSRTA